MPRPKQRTPELREQVLAAALSLLARSDVAGLTTREVARLAGTSPAALYELFGDKAGLVRAIFLEGYRRLNAVFAAAPTTDDPLADASALIALFRRFARENPTLVEVMFGRPFHDFRPGRDDVRAAVSIQGAVLDRVRRCLDAGLVAGDPTDIAHVVMAMAQGMAAAENAGRLGSARSANRRWALAIDALFDGLRPR